MTSLSHCLKQTSFTGFKCFRILVKKIKNTLSEISQSLWRA